MHRRPFLVTADRECIPLEGPYRIEAIRGDWYVLGEHRALRCESESAARVRLAGLAAERDADALASDALEGLPDDFEVVSRST